MVLLLNKTISMEIMQQMRTDEEIDVLKGMVRALERRHSSQVNIRLTSVFCNLGSSTFETSSLAVCRSSSSGLYSLVLSHLQ